MKRRTKIVLIAVGVVAVIAAVVAVGQSRKPKGTPVRTAKVARQDLVSVITANGTIQAKTKVDLSANVMGQITRLNVEEGQAVKKGDLLLVIDQVRYAAAVEGSRSNLQALEAEVARASEAAAQAKRDQQRAEQQFKEGIIAAADHDRARSLYDQAVSAARRAERQVEQAHADLASSSDALEKTEIRAPMDGIVTRRNVEQGEVVVTGTMNNPGTQLMTISDMATVEAVLEVDQTDVPRLGLGQSASVLIDAFPDSPFPGVVAEIGSSPIRGQSALGGAATGTDYEVKVTLTKHPEGVRPGLTVTADIITETRNGVLAVPIGALVLRQPEAKGKPGASPDAAPTAPADQKESVGSRARDIEGVYLIDGKKVEFRPVQTGIKGELEVEVTDGLKEGDEIVVGPFRALRALKPGDQVIVDNSERPEIDR
ncbi:MAG: efflux RND transporter periplasmic adaptor subunit [Acidobacteriota bacterium]